MSGMKLGDYTFDSGRVLYLSSLRACVISDLIEAVDARNHKQGSEARIQNIERVHKQFERWRAQYQPEVLVILGEVLDGDLGSESPARALVKLWCSSGVRVIIVTPQLHRNSTALLESLGCEVHQELIWGRYRFGVSLESGLVDPRFFTITARPHFSIKFASGMLRSRRLSVFLKGLGHIVVPSLDSKAVTKSVLRSSLARYDVFAVGHQRILPLGKVADLKARRGLLRGLKLTVASAHRAAGTHKKEGKSHAKHKTLVQ